MNLVIQTGTRGMPDAHAKAPEYATLSPLSIQIGEERLCADAWEIGDFLAGSESDREPCAYFGPISVPELLETALSINATAEQVYEAMRELRRRLIEDKSEYVLAAAQRVEES